MINKIEEWGLDIEKEYHMTKTSSGIIRDNKISLSVVIHFWTEYNKYLNIGLDELIKKLKTEPVQMGTYKIYTTYRLHHDYAIPAVIFSDYLGDEFEEYLKDNEIELGNWQPSDVEEFFEQYGIEVY